MSTKNTTNKNNNSNADKAKAPEGLALWTHPTVNVAAYATASRKISGLRVTLHGASVSLWLTKTAAEALHSKLSALWEGKEADASKPYLTGKLDAVKCAAQYGQYDRELPVGFTATRSTEAPALEDPEHWVEISHTLRLRIGHYEALALKGKTKCASDKYARQAYQDATALAAFMAQAMKVTANWKEPEKLATALQVEPILPNGGWSNLRIE